MSLLYSSIVSASRICMESLCFLAGVIRPSYPKSCRRACRARPFPALPCASTRSSFFFVVSSGRLPSVPPRLLRTAWFLPESGPACAHATADSTEQMLFVASPFSAAAAPAAAKGT